MKNILKYLVSFLLLLSLTGCKNTARMSVEKYLNNYINLSSEVENDIDNMIEKENLNEENKSLYKKVFEKAYSNISYKVEKEEYNGNNATISVNVKVLDLYKAQDLVTKYLKENENDFYIDDKLDTQKYMKYKLEKMLDVTDTVEYTIDFYLIKENDNWILTSLSNSDLEKLHGIYNYES